MQHLVGEFSHLSLGEFKTYKQVWIYEDPADGDLNMVSHNDIISPAFPLCMTWLNQLKGGERGRLQVRSFDFRFSSN